MDNLASVFCLIALLLWKNQLLYEIVKVPPEAVYMEDKGFHIALNAGEQLTVEQRLYAIMLALAYDMALITRAALQYDMFQTVSGTSYYEIPPTEHQKDLICM